MCGCGQKKTRRIRGKGTFGRIAFRIINTLVLTGVALVCLYPLWHVLMASVSNPELLAEHRGLVFYPLSTAGKRATWIGYRAALQNMSVLRGMANSLFYVGTGTLLHTALCSVAAFCITRRKTLWMRYLVGMLIFSMLFQAGMIPTYMLNRRLGLYNTRWVIVAVGLLPVLHIAHVGCAMRALPRSLEESARLDGAGAFTILTKITLPLVKSSLIGVSMFYAVGKWNEYLTPSVYLVDRKLFPLQLILRERLIEAVSWSYDNKTEKLIQLSVMALSSMPLLCVWPFFKKYLEKGIVLGTAKEIKGGSNYERRLFSR